MVQRRLGFQSRRVQSDVTRLKQPILEGHVNAAIGHAYSLTEPSVISVQHALLGIVAASRKNASEAYDFLLTCLDHWSNLEIVRAAVSRSRAMRIDQSSPKFSPGLTISWKRGTKFLRDAGRKSLWGRDYVTIIMLTNDDFSFAEVALAQRTSIAELREQWFSFVIADKTRPRLFWEEWWRSSRVLLPGKRLVSGTIDSGLHPLVFGGAPRWANCWGQDLYGIYAEVLIPDTSITMRLRWIRPGRFSMGSPGLDNRIFGPEAPVHEVAITSGFWLAETPCTQAI
jgi:hypothetical protein